jgi:hypothetical protein
VGRPPLRAALLWLTLALPLASVSAQQPPASSGGAGLEPPSASLLSELESHRVVLSENASGDGDRAGNAQALVLFERPRLEVLKLLASTPRQKEYRPELTRLQVIEASERSDVAEYRVRFMLTTLVYRARHGWDMEAGRVWWTLDPAFDNDVEVLDGLWELRALDARRTFGRFTTRIDLGPSVPAFLQDYATRKQLPASMETLRRWVDSGGRWRP